MTVETKFGWVLNGLGIGLEASANLTFEIEDAHVLFLNTKQSVKKKTLISM